MSAQLLKFFTFYPSSVFDVQTEAKSMMALLKPSHTDSRAVDPTESLTEALLSFHGMLTEEQKQQFQESTVKPDAASVIVFVAEISAKTKSTSVVETFVSSNPTVAALVWGGVKTAILTASNVAPYFDKVTSMIMAVGRSSIFVPFEAEFRPFVDKLDQAAKDIQLQILLASKQAEDEAKKLLEHESKDNAAFQQLSLKFHRDSNREYAKARQWRIDKMKREAAKLKSSIRHNLSIINYVKPWKPAMQQHAPSTAKWLEQRSFFRQWKDDGDTAILWCSGTMGVGKTVLMSNVVAQLYASRKTNNIISYYFCSANNIASLSARSILRTLTRQMLDSQIEHAKHGNLRALDKDSHDMETTEFVNFLLSHLQVSKTYYLVLDGLDEYGRGEIQSVARGLSQLCHKCITGLKILCAGRPELKKEI